MSGSFEAVVADITLESRVGLAGTWQMSLDPQGFQVGETGMLEAVTRSGTRLEIPVLSVVADEAGVVWCVVEKPLAAGTDVSGRVAAI
jgi:alanyl-tRNA synthetase